MANEDLHGAEGINELCGRLGPGWRCQGSETSNGFFMELLKTGDNVVAKHCPSFILGEEQKWKYATRGIVYALGLAYCFVGLAVITGVYMKALNCIVKHSKRLVKRDPVTGVRIFREERIWNDAVADILLLGLGTCAPQVSLAVIDAVQHFGRDSANELGAGTLLGSTAFNLFVILAVCMVTPKRYQSKCISNIGVYIVEVAWSFWAYVWLFLILQIWTPNEVTLLEAILTLIQFPILTLHAYIQDQRWKYISLPVKSGVNNNTNTTDNFEELSTISRDSKFATRYNESSESSTVKSTLHFNDGTSDVLEVETRSRDENDQLFTDRTPSWKEVWKNQFYEAMSVGGSKHPPSAAELIFHPFISYWKISFAFIPPVQVLHGWFAFLGSIFFITWISFLVVELSNRFHCVTGMSSYALALTVLATGTSLPNLFASKIAAEVYQTADSAIANVNASNCINVYVGFGIPWCISAIYNAAHRHKGVNLPGKGLGFILSIYFGAAIVCFVILTARRSLLGGELGGPKRWAWLSSATFLLLWLVFLSFACLIDIFT